MRTCVCTVYGSIKIPNISGLKFWSGSKPMAFKRVLVDLCSDDHEQ